MTSVYVRQESERNHSGISGTELVPGALDVKGLKDLIAGGRYGK